MKFDLYQETLDFLADGNFTGFAPRWIIPSHVRLPTDENRNASILLFVIDSKREVDYGLSKGFS